MSDTPAVNVGSTEERETGLLEIAATIWRRKISITVAVLTGAIIFGSVALVLPKKYQASVLMAPVTSEAGAGLGTLESVTARFGGLASLAGISADANADQRSITIATLQSHELTEQFIKENNLLPILYSDKWNSAKKIWTTKRPPTLWFADRYFGAKIRSVTESRKTGLVTLTITWTNPTLAASWANGLVAMVNAKMRSQAIRRSQRTIAFLQQQADATNVVELRDAIYSLMKTEIEREMVARGKQQYALRIIDPAIAPQKRASPITLIWVLAGAIFGFIVASMIVLVKELG